LKKLTSIPERFLSSWQTEVLLLQVIALVCIPKTSPNTLTETGGQGGWVFGLELGERHPSDSMINADRGVTVRVELLQRGEIGRILDSIRHELGVWRWSVDRLRELPMGPMGGPGIRAAGVSTFRVPDPTSTGSGT
jgi:hypothetical protein